MAETETERSPSGAALYELLEKTPARAPHHEDGTLLLLASINCNTHQTQGLDPDAMRSLREDLTQLRNPDEAPIFMHALMFIANECAHGGQPNQYVPSLTTPEREALATVHAKLNGLLNKQYKEATRKDAAKIYDSLRAIGG